MTCSEPKSTSLVQSSCLLALGLLRSSEKMSARVNTGGLKVDSTLHEFVQNELVQGTGLDTDTFWAAFAAIVNDLGPKNAELLRQRDFLQTQLDTYNAEHGLAGDQDQAAYQQFLTDIGYLVPEGPAFTVTTPNVDPEIASVTAPWSLLLAAAGCSPAPSCRGEYR